MAELVASSFNHMCYFGPPDPLDRRRLYAGGRLVDDEAGTERLLNFKDVMRIEAEALSSHLPPENPWSWHLAKIRANQSSLDHTGEAKG
ncbi:hypothetical protein AB3Y40_06925 [Yoonia sp. R2331]|uniref:hypothetical protein n=1 Tax=Yoonia sp. R2331 TaxID=3237238 RepID=UPI0034E393AA